MSLFIDDSPDFLAARTADLLESETSRFRRLVQVAIESGKDVIELSAGEPNYPPPIAALESASRAAAAGIAKYGATAGTPALRRLIADRTNARMPSLSQPWTPDNVVVVYGAKQGIVHGLLTVLDPGDELLIPNPGWASYAEMGRMCGAVVRGYGRGFAEGFRIGGLDSALTERTKVVIVNNPCNPTGVVSTREELRRTFAPLLEKEHYRRVWIISDEVYDELTYGETGVCAFAEALPELAERTITINSLSKSAAMPGWRVGWVVATDRVTRRVIALQTHSTSGVNPISQIAAEAVLGEGLVGFTTDARRSLRAKRDLVARELSKNPLFEFLVPEGAFYFFVRVRGISDTSQFARDLIDRYGVSVVPGGPFGFPDFFRLTFACEELRLKEGLARLSRAATLEASGTAGMFFSGRIPESDRNGAHAHA